MRKYLITVAVVIAASPLFVSADTVTDLRVQFQSVLARLAELQQELALVESSAAQGAVSGVCATINQNLSLGMENAEVKKLQEYLARDKSIYPEAITSGYYGMLTQQAVQRWQVQYGVVSSGSPSTTGYGAVGPKTRAAMAAACTATPSSVGSQNVVSFAFTAPSLQAPADAILQLTMLEDACMSYQIYWGDGSTPTGLEATRTSYCGTVQTHTLTHRYATSGTYTATLYAVRGPMASLGDTPVLTATITILAGSPYVRVLSPNGGESLRLGDTVPIKWEVANQPTDSAVAFYIVGPTGTYRFAKRSHATQTFNWIVGDRVCDGNGCDIQLPVGVNTYAVRAVLYAPADACLDSCTDGNYTAPQLLASDESDSRFSILNIGAGGATPLTVAQASGEAPFTVAVTAQVQPTSADVANFEVDFGDGSTTYKINVPPGEINATTKHFSHTYAQAGTYTLRLRPLGAVQYVAEQRITVNSSTFTVSPNSGGYVPLTVRTQFNVDGSCSQSNELTRVYTVDWGDNSETSRYEVTVPQCTTSGAGAQSLTSHSFTHAYTLPGAYSVRLRIDADGAYTSKVETLDVGKSSFSISPSFGFKPLAVTASYTADQSCVMGDATTVTYTIDWGDGTARTVYSKALAACATGTVSQAMVDKTYTHTYAEIGNYTATLTVRKANIGTSYTLSRQVVVDRSALRNGYRAVASAVNIPALRESMAAALQALLR